MVLVQITLHFYSSTAFWSFINIFNSAVFMFAESNLKVTCYFKM